MNVLERGELQNRMIKNMRSKTSEITYYGPGPIRSFLYAISVELQHLYYRLFRADLRQDPLRAIGSDLDTVAKSRGLTRLGAAASSAVVEFTGTIGTVIPINFAIKNAAGVTYNTTETGTIAANTLFSGVNGLKRLVVQSTGLGSSTKSERNSLTTMVVPGNVTGGSLISVTNPAPSVGGADAETDDQLRSRIVNYFTALNQGTRVFYENTVRNSNSTVTRAYVYKGQYPHTVNVNVVTRSGASLDSTALNAIATFLGPNTPIQVSVNVSNITYTSIDIAFSGSIKSGFTAADIVNNVAYNLNQFLDWSVWGFGVPVQWDDLLAIVSNSAGVDKIAPGSFTPNIDTTVTFNSLPKLTSVSFTDTTSQSTSTFSAITTEFPRL